MSCGTLSRTRRTVLQIILHRISYRSPGDLSSLQGQGQDCPLAIWFLCQWPTEQSCTGTGVLEVPLFLTTFTDQIPFPCRVNKDRETHSTCKSPSTLILRIVYPLPAGWTGRISLKTCLEPSTFSISDDRSNYPTTAPPSVAQNTYWLGHFHAANNRLILETSMNGLIN